MLSLLSVYQADLMKNWKRSEDSVITEAGLRCADIAIMKALSMVSGFEAHASARSDRYSVWRLALNREW